MAFQKRIGLPLKKLSSALFDRPVKRLRFYVSEIENPRLPEAFDGIRVMHLSDLHTKNYGKNGQRLVSKCGRHSPDLIVFTGDLFSRNESLDKILSKVPMMRALAKLAPVYYVIGNHEADAGEKTLILCRALENAGICVLRNERAEIFRGNEKISIYGLEMPFDCYRNKKGGYSGLRRLSLSDLNNMLGTPDKDGYNLLLAHSPIQFEEYASWGADLTLSGHIHGGIVRIAGVGLFSPERRFFPKYSKGIYRKQTQRGQAVMEVSAGLGKMRINNPESVSICILRRQKNDR